MEAIVLLLLAAPIFFFLFSVFWTHTSSSAIAEEHREQVRIVRERVLSRRAYQSSSASSSPSSSSSPSAASSPSSSSSSDSRRREEREDDETSRDRRRRDAEEVLRRRIEHQRQREGEYSDEQHLFSPQAYTDLSSSSSSSSPPPSYADATASTSFSSVPSSSSSSSAPSSAPSSSASSSSSSSSPAADAPPDCPICLELPSFACETNCAHVFCSDCILEYYERGSAASSSLVLQPIRCPCCRRAITVLLARFSATEMQEEQHKQREAFTKARLQEYNRQHSGAPRSWRERLADTPHLLRRLFMELTSSPDAALRLALHSHFFFSFAATLLYVASPFDFLSESAFGLLGFVDDAIIFLGFFVVAASIYRALVLNRHQGPAPHAAFQHAGHAASMMWAQ